MTSEDRSGLLIAIADLLTQAGEARVAQVFGNLAEDVQAARDTESSREVLRRALALYSGGMGSFQDLVLQNASGVLPEQAELDTLRRALFEEARRDLD